MIRNKKWKAGKFKDFPCCNRNGLFTYKLFDIGKMWIAKSPVYFYDVCTVNLLKIRSVRMHFDFLSHYQFAFTTHYRLYF